MKRSLLVICLLLGLLGVMTQAGTTQAPGAVQTEPKTKSSIVLPKLPITYLNLTLPQPTVEPKLVPVPEPKVATVTQVKQEPPKKESKVEILSTKPKEEPKPKGEKRFMELTAYTAGYESTQKKKGQDGYNQPAISGSKYADFETVYCEVGITVAAGKNIPLGTKVYIPSLKDKWDGDGIFIVQDRGGAIGPNDLDIYFGEGKAALEDAKDYGRQKHVEVIILWEE